MTLPLALIGKVAETTTRGELSLPLKPDLALVEDLQAKLVVSDGFVVKAALERFHWLAVQYALVEGKSTDPLLREIDNHVNPDYILAIALNQRVDIPTAAKLTMENIDRLMDMLGEARVNLSETANAQRHEADEFEPSIFGGLGGFPNSDWCLWYAKHHNTGIVQAHTFGIELLKQLHDEFPRIINTRNSELVVYNPEFRKAGIKRGYLGLAWVIEHKYSKGLSWDDAHREGIIAINESPSFTAQE